MKRPALQILVLASLLVAPLAASAASSVEQILARHGRHGSVSADVALAELQAASDRPGAFAPVALRSRYHFAVGMLAAARHDKRVARASQRVLQALAAGGDCEPCAAQALMVEGALADRGRDTQLSRAILDKLAAAMPRDAYTRMRAFNYRAGVLLSLGEFDGSLQAAVEAAALAEKLGRPSDQARAINRMVLANIGRNDLDRAQALAREAYAIAERIGDVEHMSYIRTNQGLIEGRRGNSRGQLEALQDVLAITSAHPQLREAAMAAQINLADYHITEKHHAQALVHANAGEQLARALDNPVAVAVAMHNQAAAMGRLGRRDEAIALLRRAIALGEKTGSKEYVANMHATLAQLYEEGGRLKDALQAAYRYNELNTALIQSQREVAVLELQEKYSAERKGREIERLSLENARKQAEVDARAWQQRMWAALAAVLLLAAAMLVQWLRRARSRNRALEVDNAVLSEQSSQDPLTGAFNRRHCQRLMSQQEATLHGRQRDRGYQASVGLVLLDVDHFKQINDIHGHAAGDVVLVEIVARLRRLLRDQDSVVRWGGEEFVLLLPGTPAEGLQAVASRVLDAIGGAPVVANAVAIPVTASAGCIAWPAFPGQHWEDAMHVADLALYLSKSRGRNRATCVLAVSAKANHDRVRRDLAQAQAHEDVSLHTVLGPAQASRLARALA